MDDEIYIYFVSLPDGIDEMVVPCSEGFTVYLDEKLDDFGRAKSYLHAIDHIREKDHIKTDVQSIEAHAHKGT